MQNCRKGIKIDGNFNFAMSVDHSIWLAFQALIY